MRAGVRYEIDDEASFGRGHQQATHVFGLATMARRHFTIRYIPGTRAWLLSANDTSFETALNGRRVLNREAIPLSPGDRIDAGGVAFVFLVDVPILDGVRETAHHVVFNPIDGVWYALAKEGHGAFLSALPTSVLTDRLSTPQLVAKEQWSIVDDIAGVSVARLLAKEPSAFADPSIVVALAEANIGAAMAMPSTPPLADSERITFNGRILVVGAPTADVGQSWLAARVVAALGALNIGGLVPIEEGSQARLFPHALLRERAPDGDDDVDTLSDAALRNDYAAAFAALGRIGARYGGSPSCAFLAGVVANLAPDAREHDRQLRDEVAALGVDGLVALARQGA